MLILLDKRKSILIISATLSKRRLSGRKEEDSNSCDCSCTASLRVYYISFSVFDLLWSVPNLPSTLKNLILLSISIISGKARSVEARNTENFQELESC
jgi:hypothetical protein